MNAGEEITLRVWRGDAAAGRLVDYRVRTAEGMVVLDALRAIQATQAPDLAMRWNCKAGKCGSCSAEVNGHPRLTCMTRLTEVAGEGNPLTVAPYLNNKPPFDPVIDFTPIMKLGVANFCMVANPAFPANDLTGLIALAKREPALQPGAA